MPLACTWAQCVLVGEAESSQVRLTELGCRTRANRRAGGSPTPDGQFVCSGCCESVPERGGLLHKTDLLPLNLINQILPERASCSCWQVSVGEISDVARPSEGERQGSHKS